MKYYKITAERVTGFTALVQGLQEKRIEVIGAGCGHTFDSMYLIVLHCDASTAESVRQMVWAANHGAFCKVEEVTGDEVDELC